MWEDKIDKVIFCDAKKLKIGSIVVDTQHFIFMAKEVGKFKSELTFEIVIYLLCFQSFHSFHNFIQLWMNCKRNYENDFLELVIPLEETKCWVSSLL